MRKKKKIEKFINNCETFQKTYINSYISFNRKKLNDFCEKHINFIQKLLESLITIENNDSVFDIVVFLNKLQADYMRYICNECVLSELKLKEMKENIKNIYDEYYDKIISLVKGDIDNIYSELYLSLALNMCVFYHNNLKNRNKAIEKAKEVLEFINRFNEKFNSPHDKGEKRAEKKKVNKQADSILNLLRENKQLWSIEEDKTKE